MGVVNGAFSATGQSATTNGHVADAVLSGPFVGTVALEVAIPVAASGADIWVPVAQLTAPGMMVLPNGAIGALIRKWRLNCSAYTSGTINYQLGACAFEDNIDLP